jgi:hypothetical protein
VPIPALSLRGTLETLGDHEGVVHVGWIARGVLYARLERGMSADLGARYATRVERFIAEATDVRYFVDAHALTYFDVLARSSFGRVLLAQRARFSSVTFLAWPIGVGPVGRLMASAVGDLVEILTDGREFDVRLHAAAPFATQFLGKKAQDQLNDA